MDKNKLPYIEYYGDSDIKAFNGVENIYADKKVLKKECIGHIDYAINYVRKKKLLQNFN